MSHPTPDTGPARKLVWAPEGVMTRIGQQVQPQVSLRKRIALTATVAVALTWPPAFLVFAATSIVAPSVTNDAGVGRTALWALQFAVLVALSPIVTTLRRRAGKPEAADPDTSTRGTVRRVAANVLLTGACAWLVLALQGLSTSQIASLTVLLTVVLHLLPMLVARLLRRRRGPGRASLSDPAP
jgi:hypothetical protein